jgi:hypothetical protein
MLDEKISDWKRKELENWSGFVYIRIYGRIGKRAREFFENDIFEMNCYEKIEKMDIGYLYYFVKYDDEKLFELGSNRKIGKIYSYYIRKTNLEFFIKINEMFNKYHINGAIIYGQVF